MATYSTLLLETKNGICTITINREDKLNALNKQVLDDLDHAMDEVYADQNIKGIILTGKGEKSFVAGADISEFLQVQWNRGKQLSERGQNIFFKIEDCPKPVIAAVNGYALGGGCELAMACHMRIASENAKFGQPEVNLGLIPGYGGTQRLTELIGKGKAMELILTGEIISAQDALQLGLVNYVTAREDLLSKSTEILRVILSKSPVAVSKAIKAVNTFDHTRAGFMEESRMFGEAFESDDKEEGTKAFIEKRKPAFPGK